MNLFDPFVDAINLEEKRRQIIAMNEQEQQKQPPRLTRPNRPRPQPTNAPIVLSHDDLAPLQVDGTTDRTAEQPLNFNAPILQTRSRIVPSAPVQEAPQIPVLTPKLQPTPTVPPQTFLSDSAAQAPDTAEANNPPAEMSQRDSLIAHRQWLENQRAKDQNGRGKSALLGIGYGLNQMFGNGQSINGWGDLAGRAAIGAGVGAIGGAINPKWDEEQARQQEIGRTTAQINRYDTEQLRASRQRKLAADAVYAEKRPDLEAVKVNQKGEEINQRDTANKMRVVSSIYNRLDAFDPEDPNNADVVAQMRGLGLPVFKKEAGRQIKYVQDEDTGEMFVVSTDKTTGATEAAQIFNSGLPLKLTTKSALGMSIKNLDRASREKIAEARNRTTIDAAKINAGSREKVANINQQGASARNEATNQIKIQLANKTKGMTAKELLPKLSDYATKNGVDLEKAKQAFKDAGIDVDTILSRQ